MAAKVVHFEVLGQDDKKLQGFYSELFNWEVDANNPLNYGVVKPGGEGSIGGGIGKANGPNLVTFYVEVDDLQAHLDRAESLGGKTVVPVTEIPNMVTFAQFEDPEGNIIGLVKSEQ